MKWLARIFAQALARRIALVIVALLLAWVGIGKAHATINYADRGEAYAGCMAVANHVNSYPDNYNGAHCDAQPASNRYVCFAKENGAGNPTCGDVPGGGGGDPFHVYAIECPAGKTWNSVSNTCFSSEECLAHNSEPGFAGVGATVRGFSTACVAGCEFKAVSGQPSVTVGIAGQPASARTQGTFEFTGNACSAPEPAQDMSEAADPNDQECVPAGSGQTFCLKKNGDHCYSASSGRQICWDPRETGQRDDEDTRQTRDGGNQPLPINLNLPNGDTLQQTGTPTTTNTTINNNNTTTNVTTTTTNYTTVNGTNPGGGNQGEPGDGSNGGGGEDGEGNGSTGGGNCQSPPVNTGDPLLSQIAMQTYHTRCEAAARDTALRGEAAGLDTSQGEAGHENDKDTLWNDGTGDDEFQADEGGYGFGSSCPAPPTIMGEALDWSAACELAGLIGMLVLVAAHIHAFYIMAGD